MNPIQIAERYGAQLHKSGYIQRRVVYKLTDNKIGNQEAEDLAKEAIWLVAIENPKAPVPTVLHKAKKLYSRWLREDYLPLFAQISMKNRGRALIDDPKDYEIWPEDKVELSSEVYHCLDTIIKNCGIHVGLWAILSFALQDTQSKSQTIFKHMGIKPTKKQQKTASLIVQKLKSIIR